MDNEDNDDKDFFQYDPNYIPSEEELKREYVVENDNKIYGYIRGDAIIEFNERFKDVGLTVKVSGMAEKDIHSHTNDLLDDIVTIDKIKEVVGPLLKKSEDGDLIISYIIIGDCVEEVIKHLYYSICTKLTDAGVLELIFDPETNNFAWRQSKKFMDEIMEEAKENLKKDPKNKKIIKRIALDGTRLEEPVRELPPKKTTKKPKKKKDDEK